MNISLDKYIIWQKGIFELNYTIFFTWVVMFILIASSIILRVVLTKGKNLTAIQNFFEVLILGIENQIKDMNSNLIMKFLFPFIATLFCFILVSNLLQIVPFFYSPTASISTTLALVLSVVIFAFSYGFYRKGFFGYLKKYLQPTPVMFILNIISDISSNISLTVRLYGNIMSSMVIGLVVSQIVFLSIGFPIFLNALGLVTSIVQAYIFSILAVVFISSAEDNN